MGRRHDATVQQPQYRQASEHLRIVARRVDDFVGSGWTEDSPGRCGVCGPEPDAGFGRDRPAPRMGC